MTRGRKILLIVATVAVAGLGSGPILRPLVIRAVAAKARRQVIALAAKGLGAPLVVGPIDVSLLPTVLVLSDLRLEKDGVFGIPAGSSPDRITLSGDPRALLHWGSRPVRIDLEHPDCSVDLTVADASAFPGLPAAAPAGHGRSSAPPFPPGSTLTIRH